MPYRDMADAIALANRGRGSLVLSLFTHSPDAAREFVQGAAAYHGRMLVLNRDNAAESTGHGSPLPVLVHGGPGRAGGGEEMGGVRGILHFMQRTALQGSPETLTRIGERWIPGAVRRESDAHPFRKHFEELEIGDALLTGKRTVTLEDIERFAALTGDTFDGRKAAEIGFVNLSFPKDRLRQETIKLARKLMEKSPAVLRYTKEALRAVRFMNEPQATDYLAAKSDALRFVDKEDSRGQGMKQFLDDKTYRPGFGAFKRRKAERA